MFTLRKKFTFEAAHRLPQHDGKCQRLHGHSWVMWVEVRRSNLTIGGPKAGMAVDYSVLKSFVEPVVEKYLDHHYLNETLGLDNPTSEEIARWVYEELYGVIEKETDVSLVAVEIEETCTCSCRYELLGCK